MKKSKLFLLVMMLCALIASLCIFVTACGDNDDSNGGENPGETPGGENPGGENPGDKHEHVWGEWQLVVDPTFDAVGSATRSCTANDGGVDTKNDVPKLSDSSVWTKDESKSVAATHRANGKDVYTSVYGEVEVVIPASHEWGEWVFSKEPTLDRAGSATRTCLSGDGGSETVSVPALSDGSVWTKSASKSTPATHTAAGVDVYESEYGEVEVAAGALGHSWGDWSITKEPTLTAGGKAERYCSADDEGHETVNIPALSDESVWNKDASKSVAAGHVSAGKDVYTSVYGEVELVLDALGHNWGAWVITEDPTMEAGGTAERYCVEADGETHHADGGHEEVNIPSLLSSIWKKDTEKSVPATHDKDGKDVYVSIYGEVEIIVPAGHVWGEWEITVEPTLNTTGKAKHYCIYDDGEYEEVNVPVLKDAMVWSLDEEKSYPATHTEAGKDVYISRYGEVEVVLEALGHDWEAWVIDDVPTLDEDGTLKRVCKDDDGGEEIKPLAKLSDTSVWTVKEHTDATYSEGAKTVYESEYGEVTVVGDPLVPPYANKTYHSINIAVNTDYGKANTYPDSTEIKNSITINEKGIGTDGTGSPFNSDYTYKFEIVDSQTGKMLITRTTEFGDSYYNGYVDLDTGIIIMAKYQTDMANNYKNIYILVSTGAYDATYDSYGGSAWNIGEDYKFAITYTYGNGTEDTDDDVVHNIYIEGVDGDAVYFGVSFKNGEGESLLGENAYNSDYLYIFDKDGEKIGAFGLNNNKLVEVDGLEGEYDIVKNADITDEGSKIIISGFGTVELNLDESYSGTYTVIDDGDYDLLIVIESLNLSYYLTFNENGSVTLVAAKITITYMLNGHGELAGDEKVEVVPGFVFELPEPEPKNDEEDIVFMGWYYDADFANAVEEPFIPVESCTLYAKWTPIPGYAGTFKGGNIYGASTGSSLSSPTITISEKGVISGQYSGTVVDYDSAKQLITWKDSNSNIKYFFYDEATGVMVTRFSGADYTYFNNDIYFYSKYATSVTHYGINFARSEDSGISATSPNLRIVELVVDEDGTVKTLVLYYNRIYNNVTLSDLDGEALTVSTVKDSKSLVIRDADSNGILFALKAVNSTLAGSNTEVLDHYFGSYIDQSRKEIVLDGAGNITYDSIEGTYTVVGDHVIGAYLVINNVSVYYEITLNGTSAMTEKPTFEIGLDFNGVSVENQANKIITNKYIPILLPVPVDSTDSKIFDGWFEDEDLTKPVTLDGDGKYKPVENVTIYAGWVKKLTVYVHYNNDGVGAECADEWYVGEGRKLTLAVPEGIINGLAFVGFYTTADCADGSEWTNGSVIREEDGIFNIYAKWITPVPYYGTYNGTIISASSVYSYSKTISIDAYGNVSGSDSGVIEDYDEVTGALIVRGSGNGNTYIGAVDIVNGVLVYNESGITFYPELSSSVNILLCGKTNVHFVLADISQWNSGLTKLVRATYDGGEMTVFVWNGRVWGNVSVSSAEGSAIAAGAAKDVPYFFVYGSDGEIIAAFSDGKFVALDGLQGTYTDNSGKTVVLDGAGNITYDGVAGTYTVAEDGEYTISAFVGEGASVVYYEITLSGTSATVVAPNVEITLNFGSVTIAEDIDGIIITNKNVPIVLPFLSDSEEAYLFDGWFTDASFANPVTLVDGKYTPAASTELYAKWIMLLTVHVHYNNAGVSFEEYRQIGEGQELTLDVPEGLINGLVFSGFYTTVGCEEGSEWTNGSAITADITDIYAKWVEAVPYYGDYNGWEIYGSGNQPSTYGSNYSISVDAYGKVTGGKSGSFDNYNEETGSLIFNDNVVGAFDNVNGVLIFNDSSGGTDIKYDIHVMLRNKTGVNLDRTNSSQWNSGVIKLFTMTYNGGSMLIFVWNNRVWGNVSIEGADGEAVEAGDAYNTAYFVVYDSEGQTIAVFKNGAFVELDGLEGNYSHSSGENLGAIKLDGVGGITAGESRVGTYVITADNTIEATFIEQLNISVYIIVLTDGEYTATEKQVNVVVLTLVYNIGGHSTKENVAVPYIYGSVPDLTSYTVDRADGDNYLFDGWYEDEELSNPYTLSELTDSKTIYASYIAFKINAQARGDNYGGHSWTEEPAGTWTATNAGGSNKDVYMAITFMVNGTFTFNYDCRFTGNSNYDGLYGVLNFNYPETSQNPNFSFVKATTSGSKNITVKDGDILWICADWYNTSNTANDYAKLSNFSFVPA